MFGNAIEALRVSHKKMNPFCVPFTTTNIGSALLAMDLVSSCRKLVYDTFLAHILKPINVAESPNGTVFVYIKPINVDSLEYFNFQLQGWMGPNYSISTACATSNSCILSAANHIVRGETVSAIFPTMKKYIIT